MSNNGDIPLINAYSVVSKQEEEQDSTSPTMATACVDLDRPAARYPQHPSLLPDGCSWTDDFFDNHSNVLAVFDLDYELMEKYYSGIGWVCYGATLFVPWLFWTSTFLGVPCFLQPNVSWNVRAQHVAITKDGVTFVKTRRQTCWGSPCTDAGQSTKTIPYDQITDVQVVEPAGNTCLCVRNTLTAVHIDTASGNHQNTPHELTIVGLKDALLFKQCVLAMKRQTTTQPVLTSILDRAQSTNNNNTTEVATLLREIRDELRTHNDVLQTLQQQPTAPSCPDDDNNANLIV